MRWAGWVQVRQVMSGWGIILGGGSTRQHPWIRQGATAAELQRAKEECQPSGVGREGRAQLPRALKGTWGIMPFNPSAMTIHGGLSVGEWQGPAKCQVTQAALHRTSRRAAGGSVRRASGHQVWVEDSILPLGGREEDSTQHPVLWGEDGRLNPKGAKEADGVRIYFPVRMARWLC